MVRLIIVVFLFLLSLLTVVKAPTSLLWYVSILVTEFPWIFSLVIILLLIIPSSSDRFKLVSAIIALVSFIFFAIPVIGAYRISARLNKDFDAAFNTRAIHPRTPFSLLAMLTGLPQKPVSFISLTYASNGNHPLSLDFYKAQAAGKRPCVIVVHGGSWAGGDSKQLPELNSYLAKAGYNVAAINYRLAPANNFPSPVYDVQSALHYLQAHSNDLAIDASNFVLLGRSAGGQIALSAAYTLNDPTIKGVISYYGPTDMVWGYAHPSNPLVIDSRKVMEDYLGGSYNKVPKQYINSSATVTVNNQSVPTLLIHGNNDPLVGHVHAGFLSKKLQQFGVKHFVLTLPWATHACDYTLNGPAGQLSTYAVERFLQTVTR